MIFKPKALGLPALLAAIALASWQDAQAQALDALMRFRGPNDGAMKATGESDNAKFPGKDGWFDILSFAFGLNIPVDITQSTFGGGAVGKASFTDFTITKKVDSASPALFQTSAKGGHFEYADLVLLQGGSTLQNKPFYTAVLKNVYISSVQWARFSSDAPSETVDAPFEALQWSYTRYDDKGLPITALTVNWNQVTSKGGDGALVTTLPVLTYPATQSIETGTSLDVQPLSGPSDESGIANLTVKSTGGYNGGISVDSITGIVHLTGPKPEGGPFNIVIEASAVDGLSVDASFALTVSSSTPALVANPDSASRILGGSIKIPLSTLVGNDTAGAVFDSLPSSATALGGRVTVSGSVVFYEPPFPDPGADDSFTYQIHDAFSQTAVGTVTVSVSTPNGISKNLIIKLTSAGELNLQLAGIPGRKYQLQSAPSVTGPWNAFGSAVIADANGSALWSDSHPDSDKYYRAFETP
jgi:type VI secretion system Hcp family effector